MLPLIVAFGGLRTGYLVSLGIVLAGLALYVALGYNAPYFQLRARGLRVFAGPLQITEGPAAGQSILYFRAPWGQPLELITYP